jgi:hypothetical protein
MEATMLIIVKRSDLVRLAHSARMHLEFLRKQEGQLPKTEVQLCQVALEIESTFTGQFTIDNQA